MAVEPLAILRIIGVGALATTIAAAVHAETTTIGRTWPIAEQDALTEIEARVGRQPANIASRFGPRERWSAMRAASLAPAPQSRVRSVVPFHTLSFDIRGADGRIVYPKGFTFNPLGYVTLPQRLVVVTPRDLGWALAQAKPTDFILLAAGKGADPIALSEKAQRPIFLLEARVKERLGLTVAPVIVRQAGQKLELTEVRIDRMGAAR
ncbi:conjugal transfer protein TraW [Sphingomonas sp. 2R-10]|uniref:conjugal transfer protein TraW n=1 Tax=Sphingomonas sp. 2R-10 TaxID=3045148 RepID=UPI000F7B6B91|nr:conjugal transfer protein TraW [Sphingomonas sp. 2R-10]MDJ0277724.1 conjugal transfer protein TraW [Sphingomonas sp. 2R-10]